MKENSERHFFQGMSDDIWDDLYSYFASDTIQKHIQGKIESKEEYKILSTTSLNSFAFNTTYMIILYKDKNAKKRLSEFGYFRLYRKCEEIDDDDIYGPIHVKHGRIRKRVTQKLKRRRRFTRVNRKKKNRTVKKKITKEMEAFTKLVVELLNEYVAAAAAAVAMPPNQSDDAYRSHIAQE